MSLYIKLGFHKDDKMLKYYLNGGDAYRLKLWVDRPEIIEKFSSVQKVIEDVATLAIVN
jgi:hypothetical protein